MIPASGTFGYGYEFAEFYDINCLGSFSFKGTTRLPRFGNPTPRIAECPARDDQRRGPAEPRRRGGHRRGAAQATALFHKKVIANVTGFSVEEYAYTCAKLDQHEQVGLLEVNVSCPNVHDGGMSFGTSPAAAAEVTRAVKAVTKKPVYMKLSPNVTDIVSIAKACEDAGADGVSLINTLMGMRLDLKTRRPIIANSIGGMSGPAIFPVAVRMVYQVYQAVSIPIIGMGGVTCARDVMELMLAGATRRGGGGRQSGGSLACKKITEELPGLLEQLRRPGHQ